MKIKGKNVTLGENTYHHWFITDAGWIRITDKVLENAMTMAEKNKEDKPKIGWFKTLILRYIFNYPV